LKERVTYLEGRCKVLTVENQSLLAEVEMYRKEQVAITALSFHPLSSSAGSDPTGDVVVNQGFDEKDHFILGGDGVYGKSKDVLLENLHGGANILCCSLSNDDSVVATGGADRFVTLCQWGKAFGMSPESTTVVVDTAARVNCDAPVIAIDFARKGHNTKFVAAGCMDGTVHVIFYDVVDNIQIQAFEVASETIKHGKYVKALAWSPTDNIIASASADGCVQVHRLVWNLMDATSVTVEKVQTLQLPGPVESICFQRDHLCCYARGTPYLMYFDLNDNFAQRKINLNQGPGNAGFDDHVSFAVMDMATHGDYLALATDISRNIILDWKTGRQLRNLYGHKNDGYSQPKVAFSKNGQYLYGNDQEESVVCVWDIASSSIVGRLEGHSNCVRDMYSSKLTDTLVTTSFDKKTQFWLAPTTD
jgi:WD40 repeat protein